MLTAQSAVEIVQSAEKHNEKHLIASQQTGTGVRYIDILLVDIIFWNEFLNHSFL